jgi:hemolysin activation/secretion protein
MTGIGRSLIGRCFVALLPQIALGAAIGQAQTFPPGIQSTPVPQGSPIPAEAPKPPPLTAPPAPPAPLPAPAALPAETANVVSVAIEGATAYPAPELAAKTNGLVGPRTSWQDIEAARRAILLLYRNDDYPYVTVRARLDKAGVLHFAVAEGYIADVKLSGDVGPVGTLVLRFLNHITEQRPISNATIEHWLLLANSIPGLQIQPVIQPSEREPGALTLVAKVSHALVSGSVSADNNAFRKTGAGEGLLTIGVNSLTSLGERTEMSLYLAGAAFPGSSGRQIFGQASEQFFVGGSGLSVRLYGGAGDTRPCCDLASIGYDGKTTVFGAQVTYPVILSRRQRLYVSADFDALDGGTLEEGSRASGDSLRIARIEANDSISDVLLGTQFDGLSTVSVRVSHGLGVFGGSGNGRPDAGRLNENIGFTKVNAELSRDQTLFTVPQGPRISLFGLAAGQGSKDIMPTAEEFYLGGLNYTRGFYSGEVTGDNALALTAELRVSSSYTADLFGTPLAIAPQLYGFYDWGETWQNQSSDANQRLRTYGIGVRADIAQTLKLELEGLHRITRQVGGASVAPEASNAVYWRVVTTF